MRPIKYKDWTYYYFRASEVDRVGRWMLLRKLGKDILTSEAQLKLEWIISYHTVFQKNAKRTSGHYGVSRKTFHKWLARFDEKNLLTLEELKRTPNTKRCWQVTGEEEKNIVTLRKRNMEYGKKKLQVLYKREFGKGISTWKIERVVRYHKLFPDKIKHDRHLERRQKSKPKVRISAIKDIISEVRKFGFLWHIDTVIMWWYGTRRVIFTAIEEYSKIAYARVYTTNSSHNSEDFLKRLMYLVEGRVEMMHSDNGGEFEGEFELTCKKLKIARIYSRVRTPKDNPALEHFNGTIQNEWLTFSEVGLDDIQEANIDLTRWLIKYNDYRPHEALDYLTPLEYAQVQFFKVSPMWSASTKN